MDKKGMETVLVLLVIALISLAVFGPTILSFADSIKYGADKTACKNSVQLKAASKLSVAKESEIVPVPLKCPSKYQFIKTEKDLENAKKTIANDMYDCWDQFGEGKVDFIFNRDFVGDTNYCFICSKISVTEPSLTNPQVIGLGDYLSKEKIQLSDQTYANFLYPKTDENLAPVNKLSLSKPLYVVYFVNKNSELDPYGRGVLGTLETGVAAAGIGCLALTGVGIYLTVQTAGLGAVSLPLVAYICGGGAASLTFAWVGEGVFNPDTKLTSRLLVTNADEIVAKCRGETDYDTEYTA